MWWAPERLGTGYDSPGYKITAAGHATGAAALETWKASPPHQAILSNSGAWAAVDFRAIGIGAETAPGAGPYAGRVHDIWFGTETDASGPPMISGTMAGDSVLATDFADLVSALGGDDRIWAGPGDDRLWGGAGDDALWGGWGEDRLFGSAGDDLLAGGATTTSSTVRRVRTA